VNICVVGYGDKHTDLVPFLRSLLPPPACPPPVPVSASSTTTPALHSSTVPTPPVFYAKPDYIGRHEFVGRKAQLAVLTDWAKPTDSTSILLFEAIGGNGKSMLTWHWTKEHADAARAGHEPWAGKFWYSFYEKGAIMRDFCLHALHYMTQEPMETLEKKPMADLRIALLAQLHKRPWLLILDGLERVLVAYHRIDAAEVRDEEVNRPTDKVLDRDPCDAIRPEDTELLRALAAASPSKILISSRLIPRVLLNPSGLPLPGVRPLVLPGLDDADAEELFCKVCGIRGTSADIRYYLRTFCDNHPLVIGVLAGLINSPGPHRGNFDAWAAAPEYGAKLNLARLDLIQSRNHILLAAMDALEAPSRQLLSTLALLTDAVDYDTVAAFNPHLPKGEGRPVAIRDAGTKLGETLQDLESRGLVQYDCRTRRYDLHPVVRGVAAGGMKDEDKERYGQRVVDHFNALPHPPYEQAKTMEDVASGLHVVRTLLKLGHHQQAADAYAGGLSGALEFNLEAYMEVVALLRPFFPLGWDTLPKDVNASTASSLANYAANAFNCCGELPSALGTFGAALRVDLETEDWNGATVRIGNIFLNLSGQNLMAKALRVNRLALDLVSVQQDDEGIFIGRLLLFANQSRLGQWLAAEATWRLLDPMGRTWSRGVYRQGEAEYGYARFQFWQGRLQEEHLTAAAALAQQDNNRGTLRDLHRLRGAWRLEQGEWALAAASFDRAVTMAREVRLVDAESETGLALAKHHLGQLTGDAARSEAERLAGLRQPAHRYLALLWLALGDRAKAEHHALAAYRWAWADGEPYVNRYELTKTTELLNTLGVPIPNLPPYDPAKDEPFPWEADVRAAIEKLKVEKAGKAKP
jgi:tetratricopeptide (TPR) repeat protein